MQINLMPQQRKEKRTWKKTKAKESIHLEKVNTEPPPPLGILHRWVRLNGTYLQKISILHVFYKK